MVLVIPSIFISSCTRDLILVLLLLLFSYSINKYPSFRSHLPTLRCGVDKHTLISSTEHQQKRRKQTIFILFPFIHLPGMLGALACWKVVEHRIKKTNEGRMSEISYLFCNQFLISLYLLVATKKKMDVEHGKRNRKVWKVLYEGSN